MTTIATDGKQMAADTLQVGEYIDQVESVKIFRIRGELVGIAGDYSEARHYLEWLHNGSKKESKPTFDKDADFEAIHATEQGVYHVTKNMYRVAIGKPAACGTGGTFAVAAMLAGATPTEAVEIAVRLDPYTGGKVVCKTL